MAQSPEYYIYQFENLPHLAAYLAHLQQTETWTDQQTNQLLKHPVIEILEECGTACRTNAMDWTYTPSRRTISATAIAQLSWADDFSIYLTGCNTGCREIEDEQGVAEYLADRIPVVPQAFRCTVYGTVGYHWGTHAGGDGAASPDYERNGIHYQNFFWQRHGKTKDSDPDPSMRSYRGFRGPNLWMTIEIIRGEQRLKLNAKQVQQFNRELTIITRRKTVKGLPQNLTWVPIA